MKIAVAGAGGRMGRTLIEAVLADKALSLAAAFDVAGSPAIGQELGGVKVSADAAASIGSADVLIDFTRPEGTLAHLKHVKAMVIGTTGFSAAQKKSIEEAAKRLPIVMAANFAVGVNAAYVLAEAAAKMLGDYDVEIIEAHHRHKVDAPSGTALKLGEIVAAAQKKSDFAFGRKGDTGERPAGQIAYHSIRGGDIVGERVEVTVRSQSRMTYAAGALRAAKFLKGRKPGLYGMGDVLGG